MSAAGELGGSLTFFTLALDVTVAGVGINAAEAVITLPLQVPTQGYGPTAATITLPGLDLTASGYHTPCWDESVQSSAQVSLASGTAFTWSHTVASDSPYGIIAVCSTGGLGQMTTDATTEAKIGSVTLSPLGALHANNDADSPCLWVFGAGGIPSGSQTASVKLTQTGKTFTGLAASYTYNNVEAVGTLTTAYGNSTAPSRSVSSATDRKVWGVVLGAHDLSTFSLTSREAANNILLTGVSYASGDATGAATKTVSASMASGVWAAAGLDLQGT